MYILLRVDFCTCRFFYLLFFLYLIFLPTAFFWHREIHAFVFILILALEIKILVDLKVWKFSQRSIMCNSITWPFFRFFFVCDLYEFVHCGVVSFVFFALCRGRGGCGWLLARRKLCVVQLFRQKWIVLFKFHRRFGETIGSVSVFSVGH